MLVLGRGFKKKSQHVLQKKHIQSPSKVAIYVSFGERLFKKKNGIQKKNDIQSFQGLKLC